MSQTYNRLAAKRLEYNRQRGSGLDRMAFDDSNISEFDDIPNIFEAPQEQYFVETQQENLGTINKGKRKQRPQNSVKKGSSEFKGDDTINELNAKVDSSNINISKEIKPRGNDVIELIDDSEIPQGEEEIEPNTQLGFW